MTREEAIRLGLKTYTAGKPCKYGHGSKRFVSSFGCIECNLQGTREWRQIEENRETELASHKKWLADNADRVRAYSAAHYAANTEYHKRHAREWCSRNRDRINASRLQRRHAIRPPKRPLTDAELQTMKTIWGRKCYIKRRANGWRPDKKKKLFHEQNRRARFLQAIPAWFGELDELVLTEAIDLRDLRKGATGIDWHIDHMYPMQAVSVCGLHCGMNIQVIPASINIRKQNKLMFLEAGEWVRFV